MMMGVIGTHTKINQSERSEK